MNQFLEQANQLIDQLLTDRRYLHRHAEVGSDLPQTAGYITGRLTDLGYQPREIAPGCITSSIGPTNGKAILLRADTDALPMAEESGLPFASQNRKAAHTCGHDLHASMLLGAAAILKQHEAELNGEVRLLFQSDEEGMAGAKAAIAAGVLDGIQSALALHVFPGKIPAGTFLVSEGAVMASTDRFVIHIEGHGGHGAMPHLAIDPISVGVHIHSALQTIVAREIDGAQTAVMTVGRFAAGDAANIIPQNAVLEGTIRCFSPQIRALAKERLVTVCQGIAASFRAKCQVSFPVEAPPNINDKEVVKKTRRFIEEMGCYVGEFPPAAGSEDFACIAERVPSAYFALGAGGEEPEYHIGSPHHPRVIFNEKCLPYGSAALAYCAYRWLVDESQ